MIRPVVTPAARLRACVSVPRYARSAPEVEKTYAVQIDSCRNSPVLTQAAMATRVGRVATVSGRPRRWRNRMSSRIGGQIR